MLPMVSYTKLFDWHIRHTIMMPLYTHTAWYVIFPDLVLLFNLAQSIFSLLNKTLQQSLEYITWQRRLNESIFFSLLHRWRILHLSKVSWIMWVRLRVIFPLPYSTDSVLYISVYICSERQHVMIFVVYCCRLRSCSKQPWVLCCQEEHLR